MDLPQGPQAKRCGTETTQLTQPCGPQPRHLLPGCVRPSTDLPYPPSSAEVTRCIPVSGRCFAASPQDPVGIGSTGGRFKTTWSKFQMNPNDPNPFCIISLLYFSLLCSVQLQLRYPPGLFDLAILPLIHGSPRHSPDSPRTEPRLAVPNRATLENDFLVAHLVTCYLCLCNLRICYSLLFYIYIYVYATGYVT